MTVVVDYFTVNHEDTAERDGLKATERGVEAPPPELASQVHLTQVHDLVTRIGAQLERLTGEQRHFRTRCAITPGASTPGRCGSRQGLKLRRLPLRPSLVVVDPVCSRAQWSSPLCCCMAQWDAQCSYFMT